MFIRILSMSQICLKIIRILEYCVKTLRTQLHEKYKNENTMNLIPKPISMK